MGEPTTSHSPRADKSARQAARAVVASYRQQELGRLLDHVRDGFVQLDAGEIDEFELDDLIHRFKRAAAKLWSFCGSSGGQWEQAANTLAFLRDRGEPTPDWWTEAAPVVSVTRFREKCRADIRPNSLTYPPRPACRTVSVRRRARHDNHRRTPTKPAPRGTHDSR